MRQREDTVSPVSSSMSNQGRNTYVVRRITDTLLELMAEKPLPDISVSELCGRACVGRASFYRNFGSKENILKTYIRELSREWTDEFAREGILSQHIRILFTHFEGHRDFYRLLSEQGLVYLLKDVIMELCGPEPEQSQAEAYASAFVAYSIYGWIEVWFQRGMRESAEEIEQLFKEQGL